MKWVDRMSLVFLVIVSVLSLAFILAMLGAYNDVGPVRFIGGYPGFPGAAPPGQGYRANPSSAQIVE